MNIEASTKFTTALVAFLFAKVNLNAPNNSTDYLFPHAILFTSSGDRLTRLTCTNLEGQILWKAWRMDSGRVWIEDDINLIVEKETFTINQLSSNRDIMFYDPAGMIEDSNLHSPERLMVLSLGNQIGCNGHHPSKGNYTFPAGPGDYPFSPGPGLPDMTPIWPLSQPPKENVRYATDTSSIRTKGEPMPRQYRHPDPLPHQEYNLEVQAKIDVNIGNQRDRLDRAIWLLKTVTNICNSRFGNKTTLLNTAITKALPGVVAKVTRHGFFSTKQVWLAVELDEFVLAIPDGWNPTIDELSTIYGMHGARLGIEVISTDHGIVYQNSNQLTNESYWAELQKICPAYQLLHVD